MHSAPARSKSLLESSLSAAVRPGGPGFKLGNRSRVDKGPGGRQPVTVGVTPAVHHPGRATGHGRGTGPETMHSAPVRPKSSLESSLSAAVRPGGPGFKLGHSLCGQEPGRPAGPSHCDAGGSSGPLGMGTGQDTKH